LARYIPGTPTPHHDRVVDLSTVESLICSELSARMVNVIFFNKVRVLGSGGMPIVCDEIGFMADSACVKTDCEEDKPFCSDSDALCG
jgi:hypothetical protein